MLKQLRLSFLNVVLQFWRKLEGRILHMNAVVNGTSLRALREVYYFHLTRQTATSVCHVARFEDLVLNAQECTVTLPGDTESFICHMVVVVSMGSALVGFHCVN